MPPAQPGWRTRLHELAAARDLDVRAEEGLARVLELLRDDPTAPTTVTDPERSVDVHVADSLTGLDVEELRSARRIADLGAGAGFPGLPLALARPDAAVALVESTRRKCAFLARAVEAAGTGNTTVVCSRAEEWGPEPQDAVCARAVAPLAVLAEYAAPLLREGGALVAWKAQLTGDEESAGAAAAAQVGLEPAGTRVVHPFEKSGARYLYVYLKVRSTPPCFPRRAGMARKRPLSA